MDTEIELRVKTLLKMCDDAEGSVINDGKPFLVFVILRKLNYAQPNRIKLGTKLFGTVLDYVNGKYTVFVYTKDIRNWIEREGLK